MSRSNHGSRLEGAQLRRRELRSYIVGALAALALTLVPFGVVYYRAMTRPDVYYLIGAFGLVQIIVHLRGFLHVGLKQKREDLLLIVFSAVLLVLIVGGTLWIMFNLATRMVLPGSP